LHFEQSFEGILFYNLSFIIVYWCAITLFLTHRKQAEAGSAEEQPARNISGYLKHTIISI